LLKPLLIALQRVASDLDAAGAPFALVGGLAVAARSVARYTKDVDLAVAVSQDREAEALVRTLIGKGYRLVGQLEHLDTFRFATVRLLPPRGLLAEAESPIIDLLFATCGIEQDIVADAEPLAVDEGLTVRVARTGHLIAQKLLAQHPVKRPQDSIDARRLLQDAPASEIDLARRAMRLISERGYARGKSREADLDVMLAERDANR
jgi:predicted nucleotidyltransferase